MIEIKRYLNKRLKSEALLIFLVAVTLPIHLKVSTPATNINLSFGDATILLILIGFLFGLFGNRELPGAVSLYLLLGLMAINLVVSLLLRGNTPFQLDVALLTTIKFVASVAWMLGIYTVLRRDPKRFICLFSRFSVVVAFLLCTAAVLSNFVLGVRRPSVTYINPNLFASYIIFNVFLLLGLYLERDTDTRTLTYLFYIGLPVMMLALIGTASRAGLGALVVGVLVLALFKLGQEITMTVKMSILAFPFVALFIIFMGNFEIADRFIAAAEGKQVGNRWYNWKLAFDQFMKYPILGIGMGQHRFFANIRHTPHNTYIQFIEELGIFGLGLFLYFFSNTLRKGVQQTVSGFHPRSKYIVSFVISILAMGMFHSIENFRTLWIAVGMVLALHVNWMRPMNT